MRKYLVGVYSYDCGKKITAIKNVRAALGLGLPEAKNFVETGHNATTLVILNGDQVAKLTEVALTDSSGCGDNPYLSIRSIKEIKHSSLDYSDLQPF
jgi:hypothetical protein